MPRLTLTDRFVAGAKPRNGAGADFADTVAIGLTLRVSDGGAKSWSFRFRVPNGGATNRMRLGTYPAMPLAAARAKALEARGLVEAGTDPRLSVMPDMTVSGLAGLYFADPEKARRRTHAENRRRVERNVLPVIGAVKLTDLRRSDVRLCMAPLARRGKMTEAARVFEDVRGLVRWGIAHDYIELDPLTGMRKPAASTPRHRTLSDAEVATLWRGLPGALKRSPQCQRIIKLCLVTAQRVGEVAGMTRDEIDLSAREWRLPPLRTKNAHAHVVPLSDLAISIITDALAVAGNHHEVFPCGEGSLGPAAVARTIHRAHKPDDDREGDGNGEEANGKANCTEKNGAGGSILSSPSLSRFGIAPWSAHDLRRTALTGMARLGVAPMVLGHIANHRSTTRGNVTFAVYAHYTYDKEKRAALDRWADHLEAIITAQPGNTGEHRRATARQS